MIYIYQDYVYNNAPLQEVLCNRYGRDNVRHVNADDVLEGRLMPDVKAFFMPGGAPHYAADKLQGRGNERIQDYISQGGLYIGICAGAYYACKTIEWRRDHADGDIIRNGLDLVAGAAIGPVSDYVGDDPLNCALKVVLRDDTGSDHNAFYWTGCTFRPDVEDKCDILARYADAEDQPPAIIHGVRGHGQFLLIGPHLEIDSRMLELMRFDLPRNRFREIALMPDRSGITLDYFHALLDKFVK